MHRTCAVRLVCFRRPKFDQTEAGWERVVVVVGESTDALLVNRARRAAAPLLLLLPLPLLALGSPPSSENDTQAAGRSRNARTHTHLSQMVRTIPSRRLAGALSRFSRCRHRTLLCSVRHGSVGRAVRAAVSWRVACNAAPSIEAGSARQLGAHTRAAAGRTGAGKCGHQ